jgi:hypothetical protein
MTAWLIRAVFRGQGGRDVSKPPPPSRATLLSAAVCGGYEFNPNASMRPIPKTKR